MKKFILVSIAIVLMVGCESVTGPEFPDIDSPAINYPKDNIYIEAEARLDTIIADWSEIAGCSRYYAIIHYDSSEVAKDDSISIFANEFHTAPARSISSQMQEVFFDNNKKMLIVHESDYSMLGDTIKVFWKIRAESDSINGLYSSWSDIESFYVINAGI